jgi:hypothetical protein
LRVRPRESIDLTHSPAAHNPCAPPKDDQAVLTGRSPLSGCSGSRYRKLEIDPGICPVRDESGVDTIQASARYIPPNVAPNPAIATSEVCLINRLMCVANVLFGKPGDTCLLLPTLPSRFSRAKGCAITFGPWNVPRKKGQLQLTLRIKGFSRSRVHLSLWNLRLDVRNRTRQA